MVKRYDVDGVRSPGGRYSHVGQIGPNAEVFHLAGQTGVAPDGKKMDQAWWSVDYHFGLVARTQNAAA